MLRALPQMSVVLLVALGSALACSQPSGGESSQESSGDTPNVAAQPVAIPDGEPEDPDVVYGLGLITAQTMSMLALSSSERDIFEQAIRDHRAGNIRVPLRDVLPRLEEFQKVRLALAAELEQAASEKLLEQARQTGGARILEDAGGVVLRTLEPGDEAEGPVTPADAVELEFEILLRDGMVVDSSAARGGPQTWSVNGLLPCWRAALREMRPQGKARVTCPSDTAYGPRGKLPLILPGAAIRSEITLLSIKRGQAMRFGGMIQGMRPRGRFH